MTTLQAKRKRLKLLTRLNRPEYFGYQQVQLDMEINTHAYVTEQAAESAEQTVAAVEEGNETIARAKEVREGKKLGKRLDISSKVQPQPQGTHKRSRISGLRRKSSSRGRSNNGNRRDGKDRVAGGKRKRASES